MNKPVTAITGLGPVTPAGTGVEDFFQALGECRNTIAGRISESENNPVPSLCAEIADFDVETYLETPKTYLDRSAEFMFAAMSLAIEDGGLEPEYEDFSNYGITLGSAFGSLETMSLVFRDLVEKGPKFVKPFLFPHTYSNTPISLLSIEYSIKGPHLNFSSGFTSSASAIIAGHDLISQGKTKLVFAGGYESLSEPLYRILRRSNLLSPLDGGEEKCAPLDASRNGIVAGEGAGIIILENLDHALRREANIYGIICGSGISASVRDNNSGCTDAIAEAMRIATEETENTGRVPDCIYAAANGSIETDRSEADAIRLVLAEHKDTVPVTAVKSMLGEMLGASAVIQIMAAIGAIETGLVPYTLNLDRQDEDAKLNAVADGPMKVDVNTALVNCIDPGGTAVSLLIQSHNSACR